MTYRTALAVLVVAATACTQTIHAQSTRAQTTQPGTLPTPQTTRVTVKITDATLPEAIIQFSEQAKIPLRLSGERRSAAHITIDAVDQPLVQVLAELFKQGGITPSVDESRAQSLALTEQPPMRIQVLDERTLLVLLSTSMTGNSSAQGNASTYAYQFIACLVFDPAEGVIAVQDRLRIDAVDSVGGRHRPGRNQAQRIQRIGSGVVGAFRVFGDFDADALITKLDKITGSARVYQILDRRDLELTGDDLLNGGSVEADGVTMSVPPFDSASPNNTRLTIKGPLVRSFQANPWNQSMASFVRVIGPVGPLPNVRVNHTGGQTGEINFGLSGTQGSLEADLIETIKVSLPTKIKDRTLPMEISDVPLP